MSVAAGEGTIVGLNINSGMSHTFQTNVSLVHHLFAIQHIGGVFLTKLFFYFEEVVLD